MYYNAACQYGDTQLRDTCTRWFLVNLMTYYFDPHFEKLKLIPVSLMTKLVAHPDLFVMKAEINLYTMLVQWVYINLHPENTESLTYQDIREFFISRKGIFFSKFVSFSSILLSHYWNHFFLGIFKIILLPITVTNYMKIFDIFQMSNHFC